MSDLPLTPDDVAEIVSLLEGGGFDRLDIRTSRFHLRINREAGEGGGWTQDWDFSDADAPASGESAPDKPETALPDGQTGVFAPLPGTFYRAPSPGARPFVEVGDAVGPDTVVGIIETMKLMNPVHAACSGTVSAILADNAAVVDKQAVLMLIGTA